MTTENVSGIKALVLLDEVEDVEETIQEITAAQVNYSQIMTLLEATDYCPYIHITLLKSLLQEKRKKREK